MKTIVALLAVMATLFIAGCTTPGAFKDLSPQQIDAVVKDKSVFGNCTIIVGPGWTAKSSTLTIDRGVVADGGVAINPDNCGMTYTNNRAPPRSVVTGVTAGPMGVMAPTTTTTVVAPTTTTIQTPGHTITERQQQ